MNKIKKGILVNKHKCKTPNLIELQREGQTILFLNSYTTSKYLRALQSHFHILTLNRIEEMQHKNIQTVPKMCLSKSEKCEPCFLWTYPSTVAHKLVLVPYKYWHIKQKNQQRWRKQHLTIWRENKVKER